MIIFERAGVPRGGSPLGPVSPGDGEEGEGAKGDANPEELGEEPPGVGATKRVEGQDADAVGEGAEGRKGGKVEWQKDVRAKK